MKDRSYHESAIAYNAGLAVAAEEQVDRIEHPIVKKWNIAVAKQHRFHEKRHIAALEKLLRREEQSDEVVVHRDAATGKFVTAEYAEQNPATTVTETEVESDLEAELNDGTGV